MKYLLVIDALEVNIVALFEDDETKTVSFTWDLLVFDSFEIKVQLYFREEDIQALQTQRN